MTEHKTPWTAGPCVPIQNIDIEAAREALEMAIGVDVDIAVATSDPTHD